MMVQFISLCLIAITCLIQLGYLRNVYKRYRSEQINLFYFHPGFVLNFSLIVTFFIPLTYYLLFKERLGSQFIDLSAINEQLFYFCCSVSLMNAFLYFIEKNYPIKNNIQIVFIRNILSYQKWIKLFSVFYFLAWFYRLLLLLKGTPSLYFISPETTQIIINRLEMPLLYPLFNFFNYEMLFSVSICFFLITFLMRAKTKKYYFVIFFVIIMEVFYGVYTGSKLVMVHLIVALFLAGIAKGKKIFFFLLAGGGICFFLLIPIINSYRAHNGEIHAFKASLLEKVEKIEGNFLSEYFQLSLEAFAKRAKAFTPYFYIYQNIGHKYWYGATYYSILSKMIPEHLFKNVPHYLKDIDEEDRLRQLHLIHSRERIRRDSYNIWSEAFVNFGYFGLFLGFILLALFGYVSFRYMILNSNLAVFLGYFHFYKVILLLPHHTTAYILAPFVRIIVFTYLVLMLVQILNLPTIEVKNQCMKN